MIRKLAATVAAALTLMVAPAIPASAVGVSVGFLYQGANYTGSSWAIYFPIWYGPCDGAGYHYKLQEGVVAAGISSISGGTQGCNWATMYKRMPTSRGYTEVYCGSTMVPTRYIGDACNDRLSSFQISNRLL